MRPIMNCFPVPLIKKPGNWQAIDLAKHYGATKVVIHGGYNPRINFPVWYGNTPAHSENPYVVTYSDQDYQRIEAIQQKEQQALNDY